MRPTAKDLAEAAGVSLATVDRVLNGRPGVKARTVEKVNSAIEEIGFERNLAAVNLARRRVYRFLFLLPNSGDLFLEEVLGRISEANKGFASEMVHLEARRVEENNPHALARVLSGLSAKTYDGVALMAPETPQIRDAIGRLEERGLFVIAFISNQSREMDKSFVGIENQAAGATAARLMGKFLSHQTGRVLVVGDSMQARGNLERRLGFDRVMIADFPSLSVLPSLETYGHPGRTEEIVQGALREFSDICGVYVMSSEARAPLEALRRCKLDRRLTVVAHERTQFTEAALASGGLDAVIAQDPGHLVRSAIRILRARCDNRALVASQERIRIEVLLKDNL